MSTVSAVLNDVRFAIKSLRRSPGFALIAIVTLGLGIGANTSMFSALSGYLLQPVPYPDGDRVERIYRATRQDGKGGVSPADYLDLKSQMKGYGDVAAYAASDMSLSEAGKAAEMAYGLRASANLFPTLGTEPRLGRGFRPDEDVLGNHRVLVISHRYWQNRFGGEAQIIGRQVRIDGEPHEIVGVLPEDFSDWRHLSWADVYRPLAFTEKESRDRASAQIRLVGRRTGSPAEGQAFIAGFGQRLARDFPAAHAETNWRTLPIGDSFLDKDAQPIFAMLIGLSGFVVLIACSNLANLLLARTMARAREFAVRAALGASRVQMLRPLIAESLVLALAGGLCALVVARWTFDWLGVVSQGDSGVGVDLRFDWPVLGWMFAATLFTALAFGVAPAMFALRLDLNNTLKSGSRGSTGDRGHRRFRNALIVGQFALAMVLLAGAALFVRGLEEINNRGYGWQSQKLATGSVVLPATTYKADQEITEFQRRALERIEALPGVASASFSYALPFLGLVESRKFVVAGRDLPPPGQEPAAVINGVSPHYFETVGTRLLSGRTFDARDTERSPRVFVVSQALGRHLFGDENPVGRQIAQAGGKALEFGEIVGVVADVQSVDTGLVTAAHQLYQPIAQEPRASTALAVRTAGVAPAAVMDEVRATIAAIDPDLPVRKLQSAEKAIARANYQDGVLGSILSGLAVLGLGLAALGIYGAIARTMAQRTGEFGIRLALGAQIGDIVRLVLASGAKLAFVGAAIGLLGAWGVAQLLAAGFPNMHTESLPVLAGVTALLIGIALLACYIPARSAARISPTEALRAE